jgi:hypothetical protein
MKIKSRALLLSLGLVLLANICFGEIFVGPLAPEGGGVARVETADIGYFFLPSGGFPGGSAVALVAPVANDTHVRQFVLPFRITVRVIQVSVTTLAAGKFYGCGVYADLTSAPLFETGAVDVTTTGIKKVTLGAPYTLNPGTYIYAWTSDSTVVVLSSGSTSAAIENLLEDTVNQSGKAANNGSAGVLPATLGDITPVATSTYPVALIKP